MLNAEICTAARPTNNQDAASNGSETNIRLIYFGSFLNFSFLKKPLKAVFTLIPSTRNHL
jgi:hypothetical protein